MSCNVCAAYMQNDEREEIGPRYSGGPTLRTACRTESEIAQDKQQGERISGKGSHFVSATTKRRCKEWNLINDKEKQYSAVL